jgi:hypothetical protein
MADLDNGPQQKIEAALQSDRERLQTIRYYREVFWANTEAANYVWKDIMYNLLGMGQPITDQADMVRANLRLELERNLGLGSIEQIQEVLHVLKKVPEPLPPDRGDGRHA